MDNNHVDSTELELIMLRFILMKNPANQNLSPEDLDELTRKEFKESKE